jgi:hypothetical protein
MTKDFVIRFHALAYNKSPPPPPSPSLSPRPEEINFSESFKLSSSRLLRRRLDSRVTRERRITACGSLQQAVSNYPLTRIELDAALGVPNAADLA